MMSITQLPRYSHAFFIDSICNGHIFITIHELKPWVFFSFKGLKLNKACGTDGVISEVFINCFDLVYPFLLELFNALYKSGVYPDQWSTGIIAPIFKKGNPEDTNNYRGITLTNIIAKIYSQVLNNRLIKWSKNMKN